jgi:hypothetical protein
VSTNTTPKNRRVKSEVDITPSQLLALLKIAIIDKMRILICGEPGIGKTQLMQQACAALGVKLIISHPVTEDPTSITGLPDVQTNADFATFKPFGILHEVLHATEDTVWFLDDFGNAAPMVQSAYMQFILGGKLNGHELPKCVTIMAATNERTHKTGVTGILEAVKDRFDAIVRLVADLEESKAYFYDRAVPTELIGFLEMRPDLLSDFNPSGDMSKSPSPRSWEKCAAWVRKALNGDLAKHLQLPAFAGCVGGGAGGELLTHLNHMVNMPDLNLIIKDPTKTDIPTEPSVLYATCTGLAYRTTVDTWPNIITYSNRLNDEGKAEFAALLLRDSISRQPDVLETKDFIKLAATPIGQRIIGRRGAKAA